MQHKLLFASHNASKIVEIEEFLSPLGVEIVSAKALYIPEPEETGTTFAENAVLKAEFCQKFSDLDVIADDSGLIVPALGGGPGVYSKRWAGPEEDYEAAMLRLHTELGDENRHAYFEACVAYVSKDHTPITFTGRSQGSLIWPPRGEGKFGYDKIFQPDGSLKTHAEMTIAEKVGLSHRSRAINKLLEYLRNAE